MTDEYAIDAPSFARTLRDQRSTRMKGGLYHLNQVLMAYNSNRIEGSRLDEEQTRFIYETRTITGENVAVDDVVEAVNSFELFDEMIDRLGEPLTAETMKDYHRVLKQGTADARRPSFAVGDYKRVPNVVGGRETLDSTKAFYYRGLNEYEREPGFLRETFRSLQDDYYARFARFVEIVAGEE